MHLPKLDPPQSKSFDQPSIYLLKNSRQETQLRFGQFQLQL